MGCLPKSASFKVIELDFLTYLLFYRIAMALHARRKGTNAALIYFPCCAWSLIEDLPKASFCFIAISFFIILRCCLHSMNFSLMSRTESIPKLYFIAHCTKFPFQRVFICPNRTPDKRVMSILLRRWNLS
jgi:hypothetical protein